MLAASRTVRKVMGVTMSSRQRLERPLAFVATQHLPTRQVVTIRNLVVDQPYA